MGIGINIDKAKELHKDKIRDVRSVLFQQYDMEFMRAVESGDAVAQRKISEKKQQLRDAPTIVDNINISSSDVISVSNELKEVWDSNLLGENPLI